MSLPFLAQLSPVVKRLFFLQWFRTQNFFHDERWRGIIYCTVHSGFKFGHLIKFLSVTIQMFLIFTAGISSRYVEEGGEFMWPRE